MRERLVPEKYVKLVQDMYTGCRTKVRTVAGESSKFNVEVGLHQGSALSPYLFLILMGVLPERVRKEATESMLFADDIVLCGDKDVDMTEYMASWRKNKKKKKNVYFDRMFLVRRPTVKAYNEAASMQVT